MNSKNDIESKIAELKQKHGEWTNNIPLPYDVWTKKDERFPYTRLKRIVQIVSDLSNKPLSECRVLDLGCLDGFFSIEFAQHGAEVVGIEIREDNLKKAAFCKDVLNLNKLTFIQDDIRNISVEKYGLFDAIICSGVLYHLTAEDVFKISEQMYKMTRKIVIIDTHIALNSVESIEHGGRTYYGETFREFFDNASLEEQMKSRWASWKNILSFWFTRPSLMNILKNAGFTSVYECFNPVHLASGKPTDVVEFPDRCTFVAIKGTMQNIITSPLSNQLNQYWPEKSLSYYPNTITSFSDDLKKILSRITSRLKKMFS